MNNPLAGYVIGLVVGILTGYRFSDGLLLILAVPFALVTLQRIIKSGKYTLALALASFILGQILAIHDVQTRENEFDLLDDKENPHTCIAATIAPEITVHNRRGDGALYELMLEDVEILPSGERVYRLPVRLRWYGAKAGSSNSPQPSPGERWRFQGTLRRGTRAGILPIATLTSSCDISQRLSANVPSSWRWRCEAFRQRACNIIDNCSGSWKTVPELLKAFLLGRRSEVPPSIRADFIAAGTVHVFAISGLHVMLIATILTIAISALGISRRYWILPLAPLLIFYTLASGARPSAIRACAMAILYLSAPFFGRRPNAKTALATAAAVIFTLEPILIYDIGCQLSFAAMLGLIFFCAPFNSTLRRVLKLEAIAQAETTARQSNRKFTAFAIKTVYAVTKAQIGFLSVSMAAWLASIPLAAIYFNRFTPAGLLTNLVIAPCSLAVASGGVLGLLCGSFSDFLGTCFVNAACLFMYIMMYASHILAKLPGGSVEIGKYCAPLLLAWVPLMIFLFRFIRKSSAPSPDDEY